MLTELVPAEPIGTKGVFFGTIGGVPWFPGETITDIGGEGV
jgi:hypothetical protein